MLSQIHTWSLVGFLSLLAARIALSTRRRLAWAMMRATARRVAQVILWLAALGAAYWTSYRVAMAWVLSLSRMAEKLAHLPGR